jgi:hypothetical protein
MSEENWDNILWETMDASQNNNQLIGSAFIVFFFFFSNRKSRIVFIHTDDEFIDILMNMVVAVLVENFELDESDKLKKQIQQFNQQLHKQTRQSNDRLM